MQRIGTATGPCACLIESNGTETVSCSALVVIKAIDLRMCAATLRRDFVWLLAHLVAGPWFLLLGYFHKVYTSVGMKA